MPAVLTRADALVCSIGNGRVQTQGASKLVVSGNAVLTVATVQGATVAACAPPGSPPPPPCTAVGQMLSGVARKLLVSGSPALLSGATATAAAPPGHPIGPATVATSKLDAS